MIHHVRFRSSLNAVARLGLWGLLPLMAPAGSATAETATMWEPLLELLATSGEDEFPLQRDLLRGMWDGLQARGHVACPPAWPSAYANLSGSRDGQVRHLASLVGVALGDPAAREQLGSSLTDRRLSLEQSQTAIEALVRTRTDGVAEQLQSLLDRPPLRMAALKGLTRFSTPSTPPPVLERYDQFTRPERQAAVELLASRTEYALAMCDAIESQVIPTKDISAFIARQVMAINDPRLSQRFREVWGEVRSTPRETRQLIRRYKQRLTPDYLAAADLTRGRQLWVETCMQCHSLYGIGGRIGPDLTGSDRKNLDYLLENIIDPSALIERPYRLIHFLTEDGRTVTGILIAESDETVTVQTPTEAVVLELDEIDERIVGQASMMPTGQFDQLTDEEIRDLVAFIRSDDLKLPREATTDQTP